MLEFLQILVIGKNKVKKKKKNNAAGIARHDNMNKIFSYGFYSPGFSLVSQEMMVKDQTLYDSDTM